MSAHYDRLYLNTYAGTPYFQAQLPPDYPIYLTFQKARAFRRLPENIKRLAALSKRWAALHSHDEDVDANDPNGAIADGWYDANNNELNPFTGEVLTDQEIDKEWESMGFGPHSLPVADIPVPPGGFADPEEWEPPPPPPEERYRPSAARLTLDIYTKGRGAAMDEYGLSEKELDQILAG